MLSASPLPRPPPPLPSIVPSCNGAPLRRRCVGDRRLATLLSGARTRKRERDALRASAQARCPPWHGQFRVAHARSPAAVTLLSRVGWYLARACPLRARGGDLMRARMTLVRGRETLVSGGDPKSPFCHFGSVRYGQPVPQPPNSAQPLRGARLLCAKSPSRYVALGAALYVAMAIMWIDREQRPVPVEPLQASSPSKRSSL